MGRKRDINNMWSVDDCGNEIISKRNEIITELYNTNFVPAYCKTIWEFDSKEDYNDVVQFMWTFILEVKPERLIHLYECHGINGVRRFVSGVIYRNIRSKNSPLYYKLFKNRELTDRIDNFKNL